MNNLKLLIIVLGTALCQNNRKVLVQNNPFSFQLYDDDVVSQKSCLSYVTGFDWIESAVTKMVQQYIDAYNDRWKGEKKTIQKFNTKHNTRFAKGGELGEGLQLEIEGADKIGWWGDLKGRTVSTTDSKETIENDVRNRKVLFEVPVKVTSNGSPARISFTTNLKVELILRNKTTKRDLFEPFYVPYFEIKLQRQIDLNGYKCDKSKDICDHIFNSMVNTFAPTLLPFEDKDYWDQPSAYRLLAGLIESANMMAEKHAL